jgi:mannose-6-phosphate isomerase-like protein (cupin superfamily)
MKKIARGLEPFSRWRSNNPLRFWPRTGEFVTAVRYKTVRTALVAACSLASLTAQGDPQPTCKMCPAAYISNDELQAYLKRGIANNIVDQQVRAVDVGKSNVDVAMVYRGKLTAPGEVAEHDFVSEVYHIINGSATLVTGPDLVDKKRRPADANNVKMLNGPGNGAASIRNGVAHQLKPGDVIVIPAGTGHWFTKIDDHISYLMIRVDPDKVTPLKDEAASKADLQKPRQP